MGVTVTAQRRSENMQDVPISMQALTSQALQQLNSPRMVATRRGKKVGDLLGRRDETAAEAAA